VCKWIYKHQYNVSIGYHHDDVRANKQSHLKQAHVDIHKASRSWIGGLGGRGGLTWIHIISLELINYLTNQLLNYLTN